VYSKKNAKYCLFNHSGAVVAWHREGVERRVRSGDEYKMDGINRANIKSGLQVLIVLKKDQCSGKLTEGKVKDILTKSPTHPHGIKVRLESGEIGRVQKIVEDKE
jgi:uncharacterized repeat protein (TIGR03833 family)